MIQSQVRALGNVQFPEFMAAQVYMQECFKGGTLAGVPENYKPLINEMLDKADIPTGHRFFVTIDEREVQANEAQRRGGAHIDGNYLFSWGGGGWLNGVPGRVLTPEQHKLQYQDNISGGMLIASNYPGCDGWVGQIEGIAGQGGDCEHLRDQFDKLEMFRLAPNTVYMSNSTFIHQSMPLDKPVKRQLLRLTLSTDFQFH